MTLPPDAHLEKLIDHYGDCCYDADDAVGLPSNGVAEARAEILKYLSERTRDTQRLDWVIESGAIVDESNRSAEDGEPWQCTILNGGFGTRSDFFWGATPREVIDKARRASMEEPAE